MSTGASGKPAATTITTVRADNVQWAEHPFIKGGQMCVQSGDPETGPSVLMMRFPRGLTVPAHWHTSHETVTVVKGTALFGAGETIDEAQGSLFGAGSFVTIPGRSPHWAIAKEDFVISVVLNKPADFHLCGEHK